MSLTIDHLESLESLELKRQELREHKLYCVHFILTFDDGYEHCKSNQQMFMQLVPHCSNDSEFLKNLFDTMAYEELYHLIKISTCLTYIEDESELPLFLKERGGKYWFNTDHNQDDDTNRNRKFLDNYLKKN